MANTKKVLTKEVAPYQMAPPLCVLGDRTYIYAFRPSPVNPHHQCFGQFKLVHLCGYATAEEVEYAFVVFHDYFAVNAEDGIVVVDADSARTPSVRIEVIHIVTFLIVLETSVFQQCQAYSHVGELFQFFYDIGVGMAVSFISQGIELFDAWHIHFHCKRLKEMNVFFRTKISQSQKHRMDCHKNAERFCGLNKTPYFCIIKNVTIWSIYQE